MAHVKSYSMSGPDGVYLYSNGMVIGGPYPNNEIADSESIRASQVVQDGTIEEYIAELERGLKKMANGNRMAPPVEQPEFDLEMQLDPLQRTQTPEMMPDVMPPMMDEQINPIGSQLPEMEHPYQQMMPEALTIFHIADALKQIKPTVPPKATTKAAVKESKSKDDAYKKGYEVGFSTGKEQLANLLGIPIDMITTALNVPGAIDETVQEWWTGEDAERMIPRIENPIGGRKWWDENLPDNNPFTRVHSPERESISEEEFYKRPGTT